MPLTLILPILLQATPPGATVTLDAATHTALERQPQVHEARAATRASAGRVKQARAGYLPQLTGTAQYLRQTGNFAPRPGATLGGTSAAPTWSTETFNYFTFGINGSQLIYDFGQTSDRWRAQEASFDATRESEKTTDVQVLLNVRRAFFQARAQHALVKVGEETLSNQERHLAQIQGFVSVGVRPEIDLFGAKTAVANARVQLITAQNNYEVAKAQLNQSMGVVGSTEYEVADDDLPPLPDEDQGAEQLVAKALALRPEVAVVEKQRRAQELTVRSIKGAYAPSIAAVGSVTESGVALDGLVPNWALGATLTWPFLQGGLTNGQVNEAEANLENTEAQAEGWKLQVRFDVEQARLTVRAAKSSIGAAEEALTNAREQLRLAEGRYQAGVGSIIELADAQLALTSAQAQSVQAQYSLATARAQLLAALGRR